MKQFVPLSSEEQFKRLSKYYTDPEANSDMRLLDKVAVAQIEKKFHTFYGTRKFNTAFTRSHQWTLP